MLWLIAAVTSFVPPLDRPVHYEIKQVRPLPKGEASFTTRYEVRFTRLGDGYRIDRTMTACDTDTTGVKRMIFEAGMKPFLGVTISARLDLRGKPTSIIDMAPAWAKLSATLRNVTDSADRDPGFSPQVRAIFHQQIGSMLDMPPEGREALLLQGIDQMVPRLPVPDAGASLPHEVEASGSTPVPVRLTGTISRKAGEGPVLLTIDLAAVPAEMASAAQAIRASLPPEAPQQQRDAFEAMAADTAKSTLVERGEIVIDASDGLIRDSRLETAMRHPGAAGEDMIVIETVHRID